MEFQESTLHLYKGVRNLCQESDVYVDTADVSEGLYFPWLPMSQISCVTTFYTDKTVHLMDESKSYLLLEKTVLQIKQRPEI